jgi:hypothetical protein
MGLLRRLVKRLSPTAIAAGTENVGTTISPSVNAAGVNAGLGEIEKAMAEEMQPPEPDEE